MSWHLVPELREAVRECLDKLLTALIQRDEFIEAVQALADEWAAREIAVMAGRGDPQAIRAKTCVKEVRDLAQKHGIQRGEV